MINKHLLWVLFGVLVMAFSIAPDTPAQRGGDDFLIKMYIGQSLGKQVGDALSAAQQMNQSAQQGSVEIETARRRYWQAVESGRGIAAARAAFARKLAEKDFAYLWLAIPQGSNGPMAIVFGAMAKVDGGIPPQAQSEFRNWVSAIRNNILEQTGKKQSLASNNRRARNRQPVTIIPTLAQIAKAIQATPKRRAEYIRARDWAEIDRSGLIFPWDTDDRKYAMMLLQRYGPVQEPKEIIDDYNRLIRLFSKESVHQAASNVRLASRTPNGMIVGKTNAGMFSSRPDSVFAEYLATESAKNFLKYLIWQTEDTPLSNVQTIYNRWIDAYGKNLVDSVVSEFMKRRDETRYGTLNGKKLMYGDAVERFIDEADAKGYLRAMIAHYQQTTTQAQLDADYNRLIAQHSEKKVLDAVEQLRNYWENPPRKSPQDRMSELRARRENLMRANELPTQERLKEYESLSQSGNTTRTGRKTVEEQYEELAKRRYKTIDRRNDYPILLSILEKGINALPGAKETIVRNNARAENPEYVRWAKFNPGGYARYEIRRWDVRGRRKVYRSASWIEYKIQTVTPKYILYVAIEPSYSLGERTSENVIPSKLPTGINVNKGTIRLVTSDEPINLHESRELGAETVSVSGKRLECKTYETNYGEYSKRLITLCDGLPTRVYKDVITNNINGSEQILTDFNYEPR